MIEAAERRISVEGGKSARQTAPPTVDDATRRLDQVSIVLQAAARGDTADRLVLADHIEGRGDLSTATLLRCPKRGRLVVDALDRQDAMRLWHDQLPKVAVTRRSRADSLTPSEIAQQEEWANRWIRIGLSTERADRPLFEAGVSACYRLSGMEQPAIVWAPAPIVVAYAGPIALHVLRNMLRRSGASVHASVRDSVHASVHDSVHASVHDSVRDSVHASVDASVRDSVRDSVDASVDASVRDSVDASVRNSVRDSVRDSVDASVDASVHDSVDASVHASVRDSVRDSVDASVAKADLSQWWRILGGQFWVGGWGWGNAYVSYMLDVLGLDIGREQELKARAYAATAMSACWWFPTTRFVIVSERPAEIVKRGNGALERAVWRWTDADGKPCEWAVRP